MALASYYGRAALAASQVLAGFDSRAFQEKLEGTSVSVGFDSAVGESPPGLALLDMLVRLLGRLYPAITFQSVGGSDTVRSLRDLASTLNPKIDLDNAAMPSVGIWVGSGPRRIAERVIYAGCSGPHSLVSARGPLDVEPAASPLAAGGAACLAAANIFRLIFLEDKADIDDESSLQMVDDEASGSDLRGNQEVVLVGAGAIGNAFAWGIDRLGGFKLNVVDHESVELSNLQRYVLATPADVGRMKVDVVADALSASAVRKHSNSWESFVASNGYEWPVIAVAVDSARARRRVQQSLPGWIANAWTQPGDLGVSTHVFDGSGACLSCLYLPDGQSENEDSIVANQLRIPDQLMKVRELLSTGEGVKQDLLSLIAERLAIDPAQAATYEGRSIRELYTEGVCGGALIPLGQAGSPRAEVHVPLAHQSALAGLLLAAAVSKRLVSPPQEIGSTIRRLNIMRRLPPFLQSMPILKDPRGICVCQDSVYQGAFRQKYRS